MMASLDWSQCPSVESIPILRLSTLATIGDRKTAAKRAAESVDRLPIYVPRHPNEHPRERFLLLLADLPLEIENGSPLIVDPAL